MNHLRELLDLMPDIQVNAGIERAHWRVCRDNLVQGSQSTQCFWIGHLNEIEGERRIVPEMCRLPFDSCWFEWTSAAEAVSELWAMWVRQDPGTGAAQCQIYLRSGGIWKLYLVTQCKSYGSPNAEDHAVYPGESWCADEYVRLRSVVDMFLTALHCTNVKRLQTAPDVKLQKARRKRGKAPLFSFWTLELDGRAAGGDPLGGTHDSPRVHIRRGHPRQFKPGEWTWVQPHMVGNKQAGMVHKDYAAGKGLGLSDTES